MTKVAATAPSPSLPAEDWGVVTAGYAVMATAAIVLVGWWLQVEVFITVLPGLDAMAFNSALCLALLGLVAVLTGLGRARHPLCVAASAFVAGISGSVLLEYATGGEFGIDAFFYDARQIASLTGLSGRMAANSACALLFLATAALMRARGGPAVARAVLLPAGLAAGIALITLAGYIGRAESAYRWGYPTGMAVHTAACLLLLAAVFAIEVRRRFRGARLFSSWALALAAAGLLMLAVSWVAYRGFTRLEHADDAMVGDRVRRVQLSLAELEVRRNAFLLTRDRAELAGDVAVEATLRGLLAELRALASDAEEQARMDRLAALVEETLAHRGRFLDSVVGGDGASPSAVDLRSADDPALRAELQAVIRRILSSEAARLAERHASGGRAIGEARGVILLGGFFVFLLGGGSVLLLRRVLRELGESRGRFASIFTSVAEGLVLQDKNGRILECNGAAERILGLGAAELFGRDSLDPRWRALREDGSPCPGEEHPPMVALRSGESQRDRVLGVHRPDGTRVWMSVNSEPLRDASGEVRAVVSSFFDITERRAAERALRESEERFRGTFDHAGIGVAIVGLDGRWLRVNHALLRILGYEESWLLARGFQEVTHPADLDADLGQVKRLIVGEVSHYQIEKRYLHAAGHMVWGRLTVSLARDGAGKPAYFVSQVEDVTERKRAQEKLAAYAARLAEKNRELQDFAYVASHDLQEPLRKIQAFGDRLERRAGERLEVEERDYLSRMRAAAARMSGLIEALLAYSRVASERRAFAPVRLDRVLQEALQDLELRVERTGGRVEAGALPELQGDAVLLRQLFQNLIGNALKYHRPGVPPVVRVSAVPVPDAAPPGAGAATWEIRVEDNGIGFEPRDAEAIFGVFHRLHARDRYEGTGVGLAICRRIVERHGGAIRAEGRPGEGACFIVTLPSVQAPDALGA